MCSLLCSQAPGPQQHILHVPYASTGHLVARVVRFRTSPGSDRVNEQDDPNRLLERNIDVRRCSVPVRVPCAGQLRLCPGHISSPRQNTVSHLQRLFPCSFRHRHQGSVMETALRSINRQPSGWRESQREGSVCVFRSV